MSIKEILHSIRSSSDKDSKAYKIAEYYEDLINGRLDEGGIAIARSKVLSIEKELRRRVRKHPNNESLVMQPEESAIILIEDLRDRGFLE